MQKCEADVVNRVFMVTNDEKSQSRPGLAQSWQALDDTHWEFVLRPDAVFSDGTPFAAEDVIAYQAAAECRLLRFRDTLRHQPNCQRQYNFRPCLYQARTVADKTVADDRSRNPESRSVSLL